MLAVWALYYLLFAGTGHTLRIERARLGFAVVSRGPFQEYIPIDGTVQPLHTILLDAAMGGRVQELYVEEGAMVTKGQPILLLSNPSLVLEFMQKETAFLDQLNNMRNTRITLAQNQNSLRQQYLDASRNLEEKQLLYQTSERLWADKAIPENDYKKAQTDYRHALAQHRLVKDRLERDSTFYTTQGDQLDLSLSLVGRNLDMVKSTLDNLVIRAPYSGLLSRLEAEIGQNKNPGENLGQLDVLEGYKVRAEVDEHYLTRIRAGLSGNFEYDGKQWQVEVKKVLPQVQNGRFAVELLFRPGPPAGLKPGQTLQINLILGKPDTAVLLPRGAFFQHTGGNWIFVVKKGEAYRRQIRIGRQSPDYYEVLEGLEPGEQVVLSGYQLLEQADHLIFR